MARQTHWKPVEPDADLLKRFEPLLERGHELQVLRMDERERFVITRPNGRIAARRVVSSRKNPQERDGK